MAIDRDVAAPNIVIEPAREAGRLLLDFDVDDLAAPVHPVGGIYTVRQKCTAIRRVFGEDRCLKTVRAATLATSLFGLFALWLTHDRSIDKVLCLEKWKSKSGKF